MLRVPVALAAALLVLTSCSADDGSTADPSASGSGAPLVPALTSAWDAGFTGIPFSDADDSRGDAFWTTGDTVSIVTDEVATYDATTGERLSVVELPGSPVAVSRDVNADGIGAVALGGRTVLAVDTRAGRIVGRWQTGPQLYLQDVSVGSRVVVAADATRGAYRFDLRSGKELPRLGPGSAASDGSVVAVATDPYDDQSIEVYDQDTGALRTRVTAGSNVDVYDVVSDSPLLVAAHVNELGNYVLDLSGPRAVPTGRGIDSSYPNLGGYLSVGGRSFIRYGGAQVVDAWDQAQGRLRPFATLGTGEEIVGAEDGRLITLTNGADPLAGATRVVRALAEDGASEPVVLGSAASDSASALLSSTTATVVGDLLVTTAEQRLVALELPADGVPQSELDAATGLTDDLYTAADAADLCRGVRPATLETLGIAVPRPGYPADCTFVDTRSETFVYLSAFAVAGSADGERDPQEQAATTFANTVKDSGSNNLPPLEPLPGLGDEAAWSGTDRADLALVLRTGNAVIIVQGSRIGGSWRGTPVAAVRALGADLVAELERRHAARVS